MARRRKRVVGTPSRPLPPKPQPVSNLAVVLLQAINTRLARVEAKLNTIIFGETKSMATLQDIQNAVAAETNTVNAVTTLLQSLAAQLKEAMASEDPAALQAVVDSINQNANQLANAVAANTPATSTPAPPTPAPAA